MKTSSRVDSIPIPLVRGSCADDDPEKSGSLSFMASSSRMIEVLVLRLLHERSEYAYTSSSYEAMSDEPEAISAAEQRYLTRLARRAASERELSRYEIASVQLRDALEELARLRLDVDIGSELRALRRDADRLTRRVARAR